MRVPWYLRKLLPSIALIRVSFFLTCVGLGFALLAARAAKADIGELGLAAGRQLDHLQVLTADAETLLINGAQLSRATRYTSDAVSNVLDRVEGRLLAEPGLARASHARSAGRRFGQGERRQRTATLRRG